MALSITTVNAEIANVYVVATGDRDLLDYSGRASGPGVWLNDGDDATCLAAEDPADLLALLDRARADVLARFPSLAAAEQPAPALAAILAADSPSAPPEPCAVCGAPSTDETRDVNAGGPWVPVCGDACADKALTHADDCDCTTCEEEREEEPEAPARTCRDCGAPLEANGSAWIDARSGDDGGTYDLCPERWDEATDTDHGHRPA